MALGTSQAVLGPSVLSSAVPLCGSVPLGSAKHCSSAAAARSTVASAPYGASTWRPTGRPSWKTWISGDMKNIKNDYKL
jgi:hypothetical protein